MKNLAFPTALLSLTLLFAGNVRADEFAYELDLGCDVCDDGCCCSGYGGWVIDFDALFLRYNRSNGSGGAITNIPNASEYQFSPRFSLGWKNANGMGIRARYFNYNNDITSSAAGSLAGVDVQTSNVDVELFQIIDLTADTAVEWSIGVRYNDYREDFLRPNGTIFAFIDSDSLGLTAALELKQEVRWGSVFARARGSILSGDGITMIGPGFGGLIGDLNDTIHTIQEIAVGWEFSRECQNGMFWTFGVGYELQSWTNFSPTVPTPLGGGGGGAPVITKEDVGFDGLILSITLER